MYVKTNLIRITRGDNMYYNNNCPPFYDWSFNPQYINQRVYVDYQTQIQAYERQQTYEVANAAKKLKDYLDAAKTVDNNHQEELFIACLAVLANELNWNK